MIVSLILGVVAGTITGLIPGIHTNLVAVLLISYSGYLTEFFDRINLSIFIITAGTTHALVDLIPSIFLGAPEENMMTTLPGHQLLLKGFGFEAVKTAITGAILSLITVIIASPILIIIIPILYKKVKTILTIIIIILISVLIIKEKKPAKIIFALAVFILSGALGLITIDKIKEPLLPLFSGLFGASGLLLSINRKETIPLQQKTDLLHPSRKELIKTTTGGVLSSAFIILFPTLGPSQASSIFSSFFKTTESYNYLMYTAGISVSDFILSIITLFTIEKSRNGAVQAVSELLNVSAKELIILILIAATSAFIASIIALKIASVSAKIINKINYTKLNIAVIIALAVFCTIISGKIGLLAFTTATLIGMSAPLLNVSRSHAMGCIILPFLVRSF